jgi:hypothetical protein
MDLLKVFVGDTTGSPTSKNAMVKGDLLLLNANDHTTTITAGVDPVVIAGVTDSGIRFSTPILKSNIKYINYVPGVGTSQKVMTASLASPSTVAEMVSKTYSLGIQIKEDLRMGTYNKNTEVIVSHTCPSTAYADVATGMSDLCSTLAKGFAANPLTSAGSPYDLVTVERSATGTVSAGFGTSVVAAVTQGARQVSLSGGTITAPAVGSVISITNGTKGVYLVEGYTALTSTTGIITLDTAYQGATASGLVAATSGSAVGTVGTPGTWSFRFTGIAQTRSNRYDQFRVTDFVVVYPKGFDAAGQITIATPTALVVGKGQFGQIRDLEEKAYTNSNPLINYREFPFQEFPINAVAGTTYDLLTISYVAPSGYNFMQSNSAEFLQTVVVACPPVSTGHFDGDQAGSFAKLFNDWYGSVQVPAI